MEEITFARRLLSAAMKPDGVNIGFNLGPRPRAAASPTSTRHIVPRWNGDNNFMPVVGQTRVLPQSLEATWERLAALRRRRSPRGPDPPAVPAKTLHFQSPRHLSQLYAGKAENLAHAERALGVKLVTREDWLKIEAAHEPAGARRGVLRLPDAPPAARG